MSDDPEKTAEEGSSAEITDSKAVSEPKEPVSPKNQVVGLLLLLVVFGLLYAMVQYLPKLSSWMDDKRVEWVGGDTVEEGVVEAAVEDSSVTVEEAPVKPLKRVGSQAAYEAQLVEQLGGPGKVEVRHLAISDDGSKMVAALRLGSGESIELTEVFFERDDFGRYLSTEDSGLETELKLWSE